jgi:hypothetical protein
MNHKNKKCEGFFAKMLKFLAKFSRVVDPDWFCMDPDPAVSLNLDPDPVLDPDPS